VATSVEGKDHESFDEYVGEVLAEALERKRENSRSNGILRVEQLVTALLPSRARGLPHLRTVRYQLLTAVAGALAWAQTCSSSRAVLVVHEFRAPKTRPDLQERNAHDLAVFVQRPSGRDAPHPVDRLIGPFEVPGALLFDRPPALYIGKVTTEVAAGDV
jgi:hypothetical protein